MESRKHEKKKKDGRGGETLYILHSLFHYDAQINS